MKRVAVIAVASSPRCIATLADTIPSHARVSNAVLAGDGVAAGWSKAKRVAVAAVGPCPRRIRIMYLVIPRCITFACVAVVVAFHVSSIFGANRI